MKKILALLLIVVMSLVLLTGCSDPVAIEFENFLNVEMAEINANHEDLKVEVAKWEGFETDEEYLTSIKDTLLPICDDSLDKLANIQLETEEVKDIKAKYAKVMETYKECFTSIVTGAETGDSDAVNAGFEMLGDAAVALDDYNAALEELATETGYTVEY